MTRLVETLCQLIQIPSVNPMGRTVVDEIHNERRLTDHLAEELRCLGVALERHPVAPGRDNLLARFDPSPKKAGRRPTLLIDVHQDTVPVDGMTIDPFGGVARDGRVLGRGACDVKGGMACALELLARLKQDSTDKRGPAVVLSCTVNEEYGFTGATALRQLWENGDSRLLPRAPDAIIVLEPTQLNVVVAHKGVMRWRMRTSGNAAHSCDPARGKNAIYLMGRAIVHIEEYANNVLSTRGFHELVGHPTVSVGLIEGGVSVNTVPDTCAIDIDRRLLPEEDPGEAVRDLSGYLTAQDGRLTELVNDPPYMTFTGMSDRINGVFAERLIQHVVRHPGQSSCRRIGVAYATNACEFTTEQIPTVVFGPGSIEQAHTSDEWVDIDQLETAADVLYRFCREEVDGLEP